MKKSNLKVVYVCVQFMLLLMCFDENTIKYDLAGRDLESFSPENK